MKRLMTMILPLLVSCGGEPDHGPVTALDVPPGCVVTAGPCAATLEGLRVELQLPPVPEPLKPFEARVNVTGKTISSPPVLEFSMIGMDMGENRYRLVADKDGAWTATVVLPVCTLGGADWVADVIFNADGTRYRARFPFSTGG